MAGGQRRPVDSSAAVATRGRVLAAPSGTAPGAVVHLSCSAHTTTTSTATAKGADASAVGARHSKSDGCKRGQRGSSLGERRYGCSSGGRGGCSCCCGSCWNVLGPGLNPPALAVAGLLLMMLLLLLDGSSVLVQGQPAPAPPPPPPPRSPPLRGGSSLAPPPPATSTNTSTNGSNSTGGIRTSSAAQPAAQSPPPLPPPPPESGLAGLLGIPSGPVAVSKTPTLPPSLPSPAAAGTTANRANASGTATGNATAGRRGTEVPDVVVPDVARLTKAGPRGKACVLMMGLVPLLSTFTLGGGFQREPLQVDVRPANGTGNIPASGAVPLLFYNASADACPNTTAAVLAAIAAGGVGFVSAPLDTPWHSDAYANGWLQDGLPDGGGADLLTNVTTRPLTRNNDSSSTGSGAGAGNNDTTTAARGYVADVDGDGIGDAVLPAVHSINTVPGSVAVVGVAGGPNGAVVGRSNLTDFRMFLYSPRPWPAALASPGTPVAVPTNLTLLRSAFSITSELTTGLVAVDLRGVSYPGYPIMRLAQDQVDNTLTLRLENLTFRYTISPDNAPVGSGEANLWIRGNVTAVARLPEDMQVLQVSDLAYPPIAASLQVFTPETQEQQQQDAAAAGGGGTAGGAGAPAGVGGGGGGGPGMTPALNLGSVRGGNGNGNGNGHGVGSGNGNNASAAGNASSPAIAVSAGGEGPAGGTAGGLRRIVVPLPGPGGATRGFYTAEGGGRVGLRNASSAPLPPAANGSTAGGVGNLVGASGGVGGSVNNGTTRAAPAAPGQVGRQQQQQQQQQPASLPGLAVAAGGNRTTTTTNNSQAGQAASGSAASVPGIQNATSSRGAGNATGTVGRSGASNAPAGPAIPANATAGSSVPGIQAAAGQQQPQTAGNQSAAGNTSATPVPSDGASGRITGQGSQPSIPALGAAAGPRNETGGAARVGVGWRCLLLAVGVSVVSMPLFAG